MSMSDAEVIKRLLLEGKDDWVDLGTLVRRVGATGLTGDELRGKSLEIIRELLTRGWVSVGDTTGPGFAPWPSSISESIDRIANEWKTLGRKPRLGDICWFCNTAAGDARASE